MDETHSSKSKSRPAVQIDEDVGFIMPDKFYKVVEEMVVCERIFWGKCKLDKNGRRTKTQRVFKEESFNPYGQLRKGRKKHPRG